MDKPFASTLLIPPLQTVPLTMNTCCLRHCPSTGTPVSSRCAPMSTVASMGWVGSGGGQIVL